MRRITIVLAVFVLAIAAFPGTSPATARERASAPANMLSNPGFEDGAYAADAQPPGWARQAWGPATMSWDQAVTHSGGKSVKIVAATPDDAMWSQSVAVQPHTIYRFSAWIKTENIEHSAQSVDAGANLSQFGTWTRSAGLFGSNDWTFQSIVFDSGDASSAQVGLRLGYWSGNSAGTAWFDDVELTPAIAPRWKILTLIYRNTDFSYTDDAGVTHHLTGALTDDEVHWAAQAATAFASEDIPALTSGAMTPEITIRTPDRALAPSRSGDAWWPSPEDTAAERDPAFDSVIVVWQPWVTDQSSGEYRFVGAAGGMAYWTGATQTYSSVIAGWVTTENATRNVFKHEWGHSILFYFEAAGLSPAPAVSNHSDGSEYVHCPSGEHYVWQDETLESPIPNSIYNNQSGFTHDYYSGTVATADQPTRCLGIPPLAWAFGGPVTNIVSQPPTADEDQPSQTEMAIEDLKEKVNELVADGVLSPDRGDVLLGRLDAALRALWRGKNTNSISALQTFTARVQTYVNNHRLPAREGRPLIDAANAVIAELR